MLLVWLPLLLAPSAACSAFFAAYPRAFLTRRSRKRLRLAIQFVAFLVNHGLGLTAYLTSKLHPLNQRVI